MRGRDTGENHKFGQTMEEQNQTAKLWAVNLVSIEFLVLSNQEEEEKKNDVETRLSFIVYW